MIVADASTAWAAVVVVAVPVAIIVASEIDERLRQNESRFRPVIGGLRLAVLPFLALWALLVPVLAIDPGSVGARFAATGLVLTVALVLSRLIRIVIDDLRHRPRAEGRRPLPQLLLAMPRLAVVLVTAWLLVGTVWGVDLSAALTALGVTSLVISFALQGTLSGLASGMLLLSDQPFKPGDWIRSGDVEGKVIDINWRTTSIRDRNADMHVVPNSALAEAAIINYSAPEPLHRIVFSLQVAFVNPPTLAKAMLLDAARSTPGVLSDPPPVVRVTQVDDPLMGYDVQLWVDDYAIVPRVKSDFASLVWYQSHRHDVPLPSPAQDLFLWDGVANAEAGKPSEADTRQALLGAPLLATLPEEELDLLVRAGRQERFAVGEVLLDTRRPVGDFVVIADGRAAIALVGDDGESVVSELSAGETVGFLEAAPGGQPVVVRALSDCDTVMLDGSVVGEVGSRNREVAVAFNRIATMRARRIDRVARQRPDSPAEPGEAAP
ncbi:MAG: mechanosensitive ion channel domain-containing protein [Acidimicrobiales bacterium]